MNTTRIENNQADFEYPRVKEDFRNVQCESQQLRNSHDLHAAELMQETLTQIVGDIVKGLSEDPVLEEDERIIAIYTLGDFLKKIHEHTAGLRELANKDGEDINTEMDQAHMGRENLIITQLYDRAISYWMDISDLIRERHETPRHRNNNDNDDLE